LVVVEAIKGTWLSKITDWYLQRPLAAYNQEVIGLLHQPAAEWLSKHAIKDAVGDVANLPNFYKKGEVPAGYDPWDFDPDKIYPGQRFYLLIEPRTEVISFEDGEPIIIAAHRKPLLKDVWAGLGESHSGDLFIVGAHSSTVKFYNLSDDWENARYAWVEISGYKFGPGLGASASVALFIGNGISEARNFDMPSGGWDFDLALGTQLKNVVKTLKNLKKVINTLEEYKKLRYAVEQVYKNRGALSGKRGIYALPIAGPGLHVWLGFKFGEAKLISAGRRGQ
jgi:hypothetical protein